jgi:hypothetical protein
MSDEQTTKQSESTPGSTEAWREVGKQFEVLGNTLAEAFRTAWQSEENRRRVQEMQGGLQQMINEIERALNESVTSPQAQQFRAEAGKTANTFRAAGEQTVQDIRPHVLNALHQLNAELQKLVNRMEADKPGEGAKTTEPPPKA